MNGFRIRTKVTAFCMVCVVLSIAAVGFYAADPTDDVVIERLKVGLAGYEQASSSLAVANTAAVAAEAATEAQKAKVIRDVRLAILGSYDVIVPPSGDYSGAKDTAAIQAAIDSVQASVPQYFGAGSVILSGGYHVNATLRLGAVGTSTKVVLRGLGDARLRWVGTDTTQPYVISVYGAPYGSVPVLSNLSLWCNFASRGILCAETGVQCSLDSLYVRNSIGSAIDLIDCWCIGLRNVKVSYFRGFALRGRSVNNSHIDSLGVLASDKAEHVWPAEDDATCTSFKGVPFRTAADERGCIYFDGMGSTFTNLGLESLTYGDLPLIYLPAKAIGNAFQSMYCEGNRITKQSVLCHNARYNRFEHVFSINANSNTPSECECFMRCTGTTRGNSVRRLVGWSGIKAGGNIVLLDGGTHYAAICEECATGHTRVPRDHWIGEVNNSVVHPAWDDQFDSVN